MYKYKVDGIDNGIIPNVGEVIDGVIESPTPLEGPLFTTFQGDDVQPVAPVEDAPAATVADSHPTDEPLVGPPNEPPAVVTYPIEQTNNGEQLQ